MLRLLSWEFALVAGCFKIPFLKKKKETREKEKKSTFLLLLLQEIGNGGMAWHATTFYTRATGGGGLAAALAGPGFLMAFRRAPEKSVFVLAAKPWCPFWPSSLKARFVAK